MKHLVILACMLIAGISAQAQTATSANNGNWISPATWQGGVVPTPGYDVVINHNVTLGMSWAYTSGSITINTGASLNQTTTGLGMLVTAQGSFNNHGTFGFSKLALSNCLASSNSGNLQNIDSLYVECVFTNSGDITGYDLMNAGNLANNGTITVTNLLNEDTFYNNGTIVLTNIYNNLYFSNSGSVSFNDLTNASEFINQNSLNGSGNMHNKGRFFNETSGNIMVAIDFSNIDTTAHDAYFENDGHFSIEQNMYNGDTLAGASGGQYCVGQSTTSNGVMEGTFDFCDQTPPATAPFIDFNGGSIGTGITWCITPCGSGVGENNQLSEFVIYPNPASSFRIDNPNSETAIFTVYMTDGRLIDEYQMLPKATVFIEGLKPGVYLYTFQAKESVQGKLIVK